MSQCGNRHGAWPAVGPSYMSDEPHPQTYHRSNARGNGRSQRARGHPTGPHRPSQGRTNVDAVAEATLVCGHALGQSTSTSPTCTFTTNSDLAMMLHKADRHLVYPPGGKDEVDRKDPLLIEERKEAERRKRKQYQAGRLEVEEAKALNSIPGLNIALSTPELIEQWRTERRKRWPSDRVVQQKVQAGWTSGRQASKIGDKRPEQMMLQSQGNESTAVAAKAMSSTTMTDDPGNQAASKTVSVLTNNDTHDSGISSEESGQSVSDDESGSEAPSEEPIVKSSPTNERLIQGSQIPSGSHTESKICRFFTQGRCNYGDLCRQSHAQPSGASKPQGASQVVPSRRPRPRNPLCNPFEPRNLLHALLKRDIGQHVDAVAQVVRFLVRNDFLKDVEMQPGLEEAQRKRRHIIREVDVESAEPSDSALLSPADVAQPLEEGALPILMQGNDTVTDRPAGASLYRPPSPLLRPLTALSWPPEPDMMLFLDPLRRDDPKPLTVEQFELLAMDQEVRSILSPVTEVHPFGEPRAGLQRALQTLDDLPSEAHRRSALELILGVSAQTPQNPHQLGPTFVQSKPGEARFVGEVELFKLGLRCGPAEQGLIQLLAKRISEVTQGPEFDVEPLGWDHQREEGISFREEKRRRGYEREADRRDMLRKLGIEVD